MSSVLNKLRNRSRKEKDGSRWSNPTPNVGRPSTGQIPGESAINLDIVTTPIVSRTHISPSEKKKLYLAAGITALKHLKEISEANNLLTPLKAACGATMVILETIEAMDSNKEAWKGCLQTVQKHRRIFEQQLTNMNAQMVPPNAEPGLIAPIKAYGQDLELILGALMLENGISTQAVPHESMFQSLAIFMKRYGTVKVETQKISGYVGQLDAAMKQFTTSLAVYTGFKLHSIEQKLVTIDAKLLVTNPKIVTTEVKLKPRPRVIPNFIGREDILEAMRHAHFKDRQFRQQAPAITILSGIGGLGKTQTALKFAQEFEEMHHGIPIYFLDASAPEKLQTDLETLIHSCGDAYQSKSYKDALVWLATELKNWLVILDNADDPSVEMVHYIPQCTHGNVIITTRNATLAALAPKTSHALEGLSTPDAVALLLTASNYPDEEENRRLAERIVVELGSLPLALAHAAGYIFVHRCLETYLDIYRKNREKILASTNSRLLHDYPSSITTTIQMSLEKLTEPALDILRLFSHLSANSIPLSMIVKAANRQFRRVEKTEASSLIPETLNQADTLIKIFCPSGKWSEFDFNEPIHECLQYSLLQLTTQNNDKFYSMHMLVQSHLQRVAFVHGHQPKRLISRLLGSAVTVGKNYEFLAFNRLLLPHIRLVDIEDVTETGDHYGLGYVLNEVGDTRLALAHREKCVEIWRQSLGREDNRTIAAMKHLALSYKKVGNNQAALELAEEILSLRRRLLGPKHPETLLAMSDLAHSYQKLGKHQAALELGEEVLSLQKGLLGPEHSNTLLTMGDLSQSYKELKKYQAALELDEELLSVRRRLLGPEHPYTVIAMGNLATSYAYVGKNQAGLELEEEVLSLQTRILGPQHPETLRMMRNLVKTYERLGMHTQQLNLLRTAVPAHEAAESCGINHPKTVRLQYKLNKLSARVSNGNS